MSNAEKNNNQPRMQTEEPPELVTFRGRALANYYTDRKNAGALGRACRSCKLEYGKCNSPKPISEHGFRDGMPEDTKHQLFGVPNEIGMKFAYIVDENPYMLCTDALKATIENLSDDEKIPMSRREYERIDDAFERRQDSRITWDKFFEREAGHPESWFTITD